jgi:PD-(D/E)XK endonuclease
MSKKTNNSGKKQPAKELIEIQGVGADNNKRRGEAAEAAFLAKACSLRLAVCKPWGDSERYDLVVDHGKGFWRVQVKSTSSYNQSKYRVKSGDSERPFAREDMDFVVAHIVPENVWYVVPIEVAEGRDDLCFNPYASGRSRYEQYQEAWCLLDCSRRARGRKDIPTRCRSKDVGVRCAVCPLRR